MLPTNSALKPAGEWASPCPLAATVSVVGTRTWLLIASASNASLHNVKRALYSPAPAAWRELISGLSHAKMHGRGSNSNLGSHFDNAPGRDLEIVRRIVRRS